MARDFLIGELARRGGCNIQTIRYYEKIGLMPPPLRAANNRRLYRDDHLERLIFIRHSRKLGFSLADIRDLLDLADTPGQPCREVDEIAQKHLVQVERKIAALEVMQNELRRMLRHCAGGRISDCRIIKNLADHSLCRTPKH